MPPEPPENPITPSSPAGGSGPDTPMGRVMRAQIGAAFSGPLPPPQILAQYEQICPGSAQQLFDLVHKEGEHRRKQEVKLLDANIMAVNRQFDEARLGQILAFLIA